MKSYDFLKVQACHVTPGDATKQYCKLFHIENAVQRGKSCHTTCVGVTALFGLAKRIRSVKFVFCVIIKILNKND
jgi:hypothetical protein